MPRDNSYSLGFPIDTISQQPIGQELQYTVLDSGLIVPVSSANPMPIVPANGDTAGMMLDAWGRPKSIIDISLFSSLFTKNIPGAKWLEYVNDNEQTTISNAVSDNGRLKLTATAPLNDVVCLSSKLHPRYEPNRGMDYASSIALPSPTALGERDFGCFIRNDESGVYFRLRSDGKLYARLVTTQGGSPVVVADEEITIPFDIDLSKGFICDIQFQWRGMGEYFFWIGDPAIGKLKLVHTINFMNTSDEVSMFNPACPISFRCKNLGDQVVIFCGCVDISSEGGIGENLEYNSVSMPNLSGEVNGSGFNVPIMVVRNKSLFDGLINTRDMLAFAASAYADARSFFRVWVTRDDTAITLNDQIYTDIGDGHSEFIIYDTNADGTALIGTPITFDTSKAFNTFGSRVNANDTFVTPAPKGDGKIWQTEGDLFIFTIHRDNGGTGNFGATYEFLEAI